MNEDFFFNPKNIGGSLDYYEHRTKELQKEIKELKESNNYPIPKNRPPNMHPNSIHAQFYSENHQKSYTNEKEVTSLEADRLYWKLLAPCNFKIYNLERHTYVLVCPVCDFMLYETNSLSYPSEYRQSALRASTHTAMHDPVCQATPKA